MKSGLQLLLFRAARTRLLLAVSLLASFFLVSCGKEAQPSAAGEGSGQGPAETAAVPSRVITLAPNLTEMMFALGLQDRLVGVTQYCRYPAAAKEKPKVGALVNMNYERLLELEPELVLLLPSHAKVAEDLARLQVPSMTLRTESIEDVFAALRALGARFGCGAEAEAIAARLKESLAALSPGADPANRPRVLFVIGRNPGTLQQIYAVGSGNYASELLEAVGAANALGQTASPWPVISKETILQLDPDIIIDGSLFSGDEPAPPDPELLKAWDQLPTLSAVKNRRIVALPDEHLLLPGVGAIEKAGLLRELVFPPEAGR